MTVFAVRVELHHATASTYEQLHSALALIGLRRSGEFGGRQCVLPTAEYEVDGHPDMAAATICDAVGQVATRYCPNPMVVVTRSADRASLGLKSYPPNPAAAFANALAGWGPNALQPPFTGPGTAMRDLAQKR